MSVAIGIDLGTTNTVVAAVVDGVAVTLEDEQKRRLLPSVVSFHPSSTVLVGEPARERRLIDPENTIFSVKPLLGRPWDSEEVQAARSRFPFQLIQGAKNSTMVLARDVAYALPEISAFVLRRAKSIAEAALGQPVDRAVITVPANFNDLQRASTKIAGKLAGLDVMRILNEPTAAALAYGQSVAKAEKIGVFDLGGGTFDITLLDLTGNVFEVLATAGDTALGGDDIDRALSAKIALDIVRKFNIDPRTSPAAAARLSFTAEELKKDLSTARQATREISGIGHDANGKPIEMHVSMTREELEILSKPLVDRTISVARQSIGSVGLTAREFDRVILVGGSTRMPLVARMVEQLFGQQPHLKVNPDEVVALGAAIQAHALNRSKGGPKRKSAHDQLANAQPKPAGGHISTTPPHADPTVTSPAVPKAPAVPKVAPPATVPEFISFNKAPAVISFSDRPRPQAEQKAPPAKPAPPAPAKPPVPAAAAKPPPPVPKPPPPPVPAAKRVQTLPMKIELLRDELKEEEAPPPPAPAPAPAPAVVDEPPSFSFAAAPQVPELVPAPAPAPPRAVKAKAAGPKVWELDLDGAEEHRDVELPADSRPGLPASEQATKSIGPDGLVLASDDFFKDFDLAASRPIPTKEDFAQGSAIATNASTPLLIDVTPLSLGVETVGGYADVLIPANSPVPCEKTRTFLTASDNQTVVSIRVAQGESTRFATNIRLGDLELSGLRSARRGEVKVAVTFELDADGILNVRARDIDTGRETTATMRLLGTATDAEELGAMAARQARHDVA